MQGDDGCSENVAAVIIRLTKGLTSEQQSYALLRQGRVYTEGDELDSALEVLSRAISLHVSLNNFIARAACYERLGSWEEAYFDYCFALRLEGDSGLAYAHRGLCLAKMHRFDIALEDLSRACQMEPSNANYYNRASVNLDARHYQAALRDVSRVLDSEDPPPPPGLRYRCLYLKALVGLELGHYNAVITDMRQLLIGNPNAGATRALLARAFRLRGDPAAGEAQISFAIGVDANNPEHYVERANARTALGSAISLAGAVADLDVAVRLLMRPVGQRSAGVRRMSRQASDLLPALHALALTPPAKGRVPERTHVHQVEQSKVTFGGDKNSKRPPRTSLPVKKKLASQASADAGNQAPEAGAAGAGATGRRPSTASTASASGRRRLSSATAESSDSEAEDARAARPSSASLRRPPSVASRSPSMSRQSSLSRTSSLQGQQPKEGGAASAAGARLVRNGSTSSVRGGREEAGAGAVAGEVSVARRMRVVAEALCQRAETRLLLLPLCTDGRQRLECMQKSLHDSIRACELSPGADGDELKVTLSSCLLHLGEHAKARAVLDDVLARHPRSVRALYRLALSLRGLREYRAAVATLNRIVDMTSFNADGGTSFVPAPAPAAGPPPEDAAAPAVRVPQSPAPKRRKSLVMSVSTSFSREPGVSTPPSAPGTGTGASAARGRFFRDGSLGDLHCPAPASPKPGAPETKSESGGAAAATAAAAASGVAGLGVIREEGPRERAVQRDDPGLDVFGGVLPARVFELRGALLLELCMHSLALADFGRAIVLEPGAAHHRLLRALCLRELGRFEMALADLDACAACAGDGGNGPLPPPLPLSDACALHTARASVLRLLGDWGACRASLQAAVELAPDVPDKTRVAYLQTQLLVAWLETGHLSQAVDTAGAALALVQVPQSRYANSKTGQLKGSQRRVSDIAKVARLDAREVSCLKLEWVIRYHCGVALYKLKKYEKFIETTTVCCTVLAEFSPDSLSLGLLHFFLGAALGAGLQHKEAVAHLNAALSSSWSAAHDSNQVLCLFARGKIFHLQGEHAAALANFNEALRLDPTNGWVLFRRAWLHKSALGDLGAAGADFETVRRLRLGDPNFTVDYKHIKHVDFVSLASDPDLAAQPPSLSDLAGLGGGIKADFLDE
jgi:tetratricopeptide (TPR) repeat protein